MKIIVTTEEMAKLRYMYSFNIVHCYGRDNGVSLTLEEYRLAVKYQTEYDDLLDVVMNRNNVDDNSYDQFMDELYKELFIKDPGRWG